MPPPVKASTLPDADLYEHYRDKGLSHADAVKHVERRRSAQPTPAMPTEPSKLAGAAAGFGQGVTSGFFDELSGMGTATMNAPSHVKALQLLLSTVLPGAGAALPAGLDPESYTQGRDEMRQQISEARNAHPLMALAGNVAGAAVNPLNRLLGPLTKGVRPAAAGATYGAILGGAQGAGEAVGGLKERAAGAAVGGVVAGTIGLGTGYVFGKAGPAVKQMWGNLLGAFQKTERQVAKSLGNNVAPQVAQEVTETAHRAYLQKQGFPAEAIERLMETWRAGGKLPSKPPVDPPEPPMSAGPPGTTVRTPTPPRGPKSAVGSRPPGLPRTEDDILGMEPHEVARAAKVLEQYERGAAEDVFGATRAKQYEAAQRLINSEMGHASPRYDGALKLIEQMEGGLTPEQSARLFGIGETGPTLETVREVARLAANYGKQALADTHTDELARSFAAFAGGERSTNDLLLRYALPRIYRELVGRGLSDADLVNKTLARMGERGIGAGTAGEALAARMSEWRRMFTPTPTATRPGETVTPEAPKGFEPVPGHPQGFTAEGPPMPPDRGPSFWDAVNPYQGGPPGRGTVLPYYPRSGNAMSSAGPMSQDAIATQQVAMIRQRLAAMSPEERAAQADLLRAIGIPLP